MKSQGRLDELFERYVDHHVRCGERLPVAELCVSCPELIEPLRRRIARYLEVDGLLAGSRDSGEPPTVALTAAAPGSAPATELPTFAGFHTIERIGGGGMGEVFKVRDARLDRLVAAKVLRRDSPLATAYGDFLREARSLALFRDRRIVHIHEFRPDADPPVILMEHVDGFDLGRIAPSLEFRQRARILLEVAEAVHDAHELGIQHRDLKPTNILVTDRLEPKIVDFGLSSGDPDRGHFVGTPAYLAPEQLDSTRPIDARTDVYALGVILYEVLCGRPPFDGGPLGRVLDRIREGQPALPVEIEPEVPEPLQAIALKAMERDPDDRYPTARDLAADLRRFLDGRPVLARPTLYATALGRRLLPHLEQIEEWLRLKLVYPHEALRLRTAYRELETREDDWIVQSRVLSYPQITLYLGAFLLVAGGLLYFAAHRFFGAVTGVGGPLVCLGLPFLGLNLAARWLYRREHRAVAVAYLLGGVLLLPLLLLILAYETGLGAAPAEALHQLFGADVVSNRQLQLAALLACVWSGWLALRTRTLGLSSASTFLLGVVALAVLTDFGLDEWIALERWDLLALHLLPLLLIEAPLAWWLEHRGRPWLSRPLYAGAAILWVVVLWLLALDGRAFHYLGLSMARFQSAAVADPVLLDTLAALALDGMLIYVTGWLLEKYGTDTMRTAVWLLVVISPFAVLEPVAWLVRTGDYSPSYDWFYLALALAVAVLSHYHQRKSFYLAGLLNTGYALFVITDHRGWFDRPGWATAVIVVGLLVLSAGFVLDRRGRARQGVPRSD